MVAHESLKLVVLVRAQNPLPIVKEKTMLTLKEMVADGKKVRFVFYRDSALHYETEDGFIFPVPVKDAHSATFGAEERAIIMMRYIRKQINALKLAREN